MSLKTNVTVPVGSADTRAVCGRVARWRGEPPRERDEPVPPAARRESGRLASVARGGATAGARGGQADPALDRLCRLSLVPRDGARVVRGPLDGRRHERALRER